MTTLSPRVHSASRFPTVVLPAVLAASVTADDLKDARSSFPSGHTSLAASVGVYATCWLLAHFFTVVR